MPRIIVALVLANGGRAQPVCRTGDCRWRGTPRANWSAARQVADWHRFDHVMHQRAEAEHRAAAS